MSTKCLGGVLAIFVLLSLALTALLVTMVRHEKRDVLESPSFAVASISGDRAYGSVQFQTKGDMVEMSVEIFGLEPHSAHAVHILEVGNAEEETPKSKLLSAKSSVHGCPGDSGRAVGDLGNVVADDSGTVRYRRVDPALRLHGHTSVLGRMLVLREGRDDCHSAPDGHAGPVIGRGVIVVGEPDSNAPDHVPHTFETTTDGPSGGTASADQNSGDRSKSQRPQSESSIFSPENTSKEDSAASTGSYNAPTVSFAEKAWSPKNLAAPFAFPSSQFPSGFQMPSYPTFSNAMQPAAATSASRGHSHSHGHHAGPMAGYGSRERRENALGAVANVQVERPAAEEIAIAAAEHSEGETTTLQGETTTLQGESLQNEASTATSEDAYKDPSQEPTA